MIPPRPSSDLRAFVADLERAGELVRITDEVDPVLEIAAMADEVSKRRAPEPASPSAQSNDPCHHTRGGPALLFENVRGSSMPVLINAFGSYRRMEIALGCHPGQSRGGTHPRGEGGFDAIGSMIGELVKPQPPRGLSELVARAKLFAPVLKIPPKRLRGRGPCQEMVTRGDEVDLTTIPMLRCWPDDGDFAAFGYPPDVNKAVPGMGHPAIDDATWEDRYRGRYITLAGIHTIHADDRDEARPPSHNIGMYRVQLLGKDRVAMHWHMHHDGASHWRSWKKLGEPMPVAIVLGGPSALPYAATAPLPPGISELLMAGFLNQGGIRMCRAHSVPLWVPADAEIVIEGYVSPDAGFIDYDPRDPDAGPIGDGAVFEGPFGDHTGFYSLPDRYPVVQVAAVTHRKDPIYSTTVVGLPPQEDYFLGKATERMFLPLLQVLIPDIVDYDLPMFGAFHNCAFVQIRKHYPLHARRVMHAIWGAGQMAWTKSIVVVDETVDVHDHEAVLRAVAERCHPGRDLEIVHGALDILDHAAPFLGGGTKIGFDATTPVAGESVGLIEYDTQVHLHTDDDARRAVLGRVRTIDDVLDAAWPDELGGWMFVRIDRDLNEPERAGLGAQVSEALLEIDGLPPYVIVLGRGVDINDSETALFHWLANCDPGRDGVWTDDRQSWVVDATPRGQEDARPGAPIRSWPPVLRTRGDVAKRGIQRLDAMGI
jgi:4-hydroxy-3-polyprenylbenzoate decarboxylase